MKKSIYLLLTALLAVGCNEKKTVTVTVANPIGIERGMEMIELPMSEIAGKLQLADDAEVVVKDEHGTEVAYQLTHDEKLIFPVNVAANGTASYTIEQGTPVPVSVIACGRQYPERKDDIAWENDLVAHRTYGPALQESGEKAFGYDIWTKWNTTEPVVEARYAMELNPERAIVLDSLKKTDLKAAAQYSRATSYHVDHGYGMDSYKVGPTLGAGTAALMADGNIIYPWAYKTFRILDNGPLRFTVELAYNPLTVGDDANVVETRVLSLDAGSHMNKTVVSFSGLSKPTDIVTGIVLHDDAPIVADAANGYITYIDPTEAPQDDNGKIFTGAAFPGTVKEAKAVYFSVKEAKEERGNAADGHVLAISEYTPQAEYTYYWGSAWSKAGWSEEDWNKYVAAYAQKVRNPLAVEVN